MKPNHMMQGLIVDNFAGGGGASSGIEEAFGRPVDVALNHDAEALAMHLANHPDTEHICQSIWQVDPRDVAKGRKIALAWFSPDCKHFSKAKGGRPVEKRIRDLAWVVVHWAELVKPDVIMLENVEEFRQWCEIDPTTGRPVEDVSPEQLHLLPQAPLVRKGKRRPLKPNGVTFELWLAGLKRQGYKVEWKELRGCDYGAPTIRKRLFVIARRDGRPIVWPQPSHGKPGSPGVESGALLPYRTAAECIDWSIPCPSIFERKRDLAENTKRRIAAGIVRFVLNNPRPFIVPVCNSGWNPDAAHDGDEPLRTVTTAKGGELAVVSPTIVGVGGRRGQSGPVDPEGPHPTVTAKEDAALVVPVLVHTAHGEKTEGPRKGGGRSRGRGSLGVEESLPTTTAKGNIALTTATLVQTGYGERPGQAPRVPGLEKPLGTAVAGGRKHAVVSATMIGAGGAEYAGKPKAADEPLGTATTHDRRALVTAFMAQHQSDAKGSPRAGRGADEPVSTVVHRGTQQNVVVAHLEQANTGMVGHEPEKPLSTIVGKGCTQRLVTSHLMKYKGTCAHGQPTDEPAPTVQAGGWHVAEVRAFLLKYFGKSDGQEAGGPLHTVTEKIKMGLVTVTIDGEEFVIVDIGMRMLTARELARAQGFPDSYILDPWVEKLNKRGKLVRYRLPKTSQVRMIGNSVNRQVARALVAANCNAPVELEQEAQAA